MSERFAETRSVSPTGGEKGVKPERLSLIPVGPLMELARLYARGAEKYDTHNYRRGYEWSKSLHAALRHLLLFVGGEDYDQETGVPHVISTAWHCFALCEFMDTQPGFDDRYRPG